MSSQIHYSLAFIRTDVFHYLQHRDLPHCSNETIWIALVAVTEEVPRSRCNLHNRVEVCCSLVSSQYNSMFCHSTQYGCSICSQWRQVSKWIFDTLTCETKVAGQISIKARKSEPTKDLLQSSICCAPIKLFISSRLEEATQRANSSKSDLNRRVIQGLVPEASDKPQWHTMQYFKWDILVRIKSLQVL
ncbi:hypothetical protein K470DRAFT_13511 [Piedraia hortae CBS 480.64]|uniref:Uncharacterized protein n=1 Tax=Piedraia hortae CBS 480.64 TaxID=1314780 RepID=A0A6A7BQU7_9PEZI|nr:hypothetical protein K470DRAFT_13511 [Piedraia hortae CBS 480.64]